MKKLFALLLVVFATKISFAMEWEQPITERAPISYWKLEEEAKENRRREREKLSQAIQELKKSREDFIHSQNFVMPREQAEQEAKKLYDEPLENLKNRLKKLQYYWVPTLPVYEDN